MNELETKVLGAIESVDPNAPAVQVAAAAASTAADPSPANLIADVELALSLFKSFKASLSGLHPTVWNVIKLLI
jgi:hypothetical protein